MPPEHGYTHLTNQPATQPLPALPLPQSAQLEIPFNKIMVSVWLRRLSSPSKPSWTPLGLYSLLLIHTSHNLCIYTFLTILLKDVILRCMWEVITRLFFKSLYKIENAKHLECLALMKFRPIHPIQLKNQAGVIYMRLIVMWKELHCVCEQKSMGHAKLQISIL